MFLIPMAMSAMGASAATVATATTVASALQTAVGIVGTLAQAKSAADAADYNASVAKMQAKNALFVSGQKEEDQRRKAAIFQGEQRAAIGQSGTGFGGSNADIERQSEILQELDALNIRYEGQLQASGLMAQSKLYKAEAASAWTKGLFGAAGQLFGSMKTGYGSATGSGAESISVYGGVGSSDGWWGTGGWGNG